MTWSPAHLVFFPSNAVVAFLALRTNSDAQVACAALNGSLFQGMPIQCDLWSAQGKKVWPADHPEPWPEPLKESNTVLWKQIYEGNMTGKVPKWTAHASERNQSKVSTDTCIPVRFFQFESAFWNSFVSYEGTRNGTCLQRSCELGKLELHQFDGYAMAGWPWKKVERTWGSASKTTRDVWLFNWLNHRYFFFYVCLPKIGIEWTWMEISRAARPSWYGTQKMIWYQLTEMLFLDLLDWLVGSQAPAGSLSSCAKKRWITEMSQKQIQQISLSHPALLFFLVWRLRISEILCFSAHFCTNHGLGRLW